MSKTLKKIVGVIAVVGLAIATGGTSLFATAAKLIGKALLTAAVSIGVSRLIAKRASTPADAGGEGGGRIQLPPATQNKLPVVYGTAFIGGAITDAMLSTDQKTMWYVVALAEVSDDQGGGAGTYTYDTSKIYYDGKRVIFGSNGAVSALETNNITGQTDTRCNGFLDIYLFVDGSSSNVNNNHPFTAAQILSTTNGVPAAQAWGANQTMTNCAFAIVKVIYSTDAGTTGVGALTVNISNSITKPGDAILDYMLNTRYGAAIPMSAIDTASLTALNTYSDDLIDYKPVGWNPGDPYSQQDRYRINGPLDTGQSCLNNLQFLVDSADSWLQYSELTGKWRVVINKLYDGYPDPSGLFLVDSSNLVGGIEVSPIDLNETFNQVEVAYPNTNIKDQTDFQIIDLFTDFPSVLSANEAINRLNITLPLVNNAVQAKYLAVRRLFQSREDLVIAFRTDYSGIQIEAGDVIRVTHEVYGWTNKLFRVAQVAEEKDTEGNLYASIQAFEYNNTVYADDPVQDFIPEFNTGLKDPNVFDFPGAPTISSTPNEFGQVASFDVQSFVPDSGLVLYMDFNFGNTSNVQQHILYRTLQQSNGAPFVNSDTANTAYNYQSVNVNDLPAGNYYWSVTARNNTSGKRSNSSALFTWTGANINPVVNDTICNIGALSNYWFSTDPSANIQVGMTINKISGIGTLDPTQPTIVTQVLSANTWFADPPVITAVLGACIETSIGGITGNQVQPNTITYNNIASSANPDFKMLTVGGPYSSPTYYNVPIPDITTIVGNEPCYIDGVDRNPNYYYPWFQGTSTTANGYANNSTAQLAPREAAYQINDIFSGIDDWQILSVGNIMGATGYPLTTQEYFEIELNSQWTSNQDTLLQFVPFVLLFNVTGLDYNIDTTAMTTVTIPANTPTVVDLSIGYDEIEDLLDLNDGFTHGGYLVRNIIGNTRAYCLYNFSNFYKGRDQG